MRICYLGARTTGVGLHTIDRPLPGHSQQQGNQPESHRERPAKPSNTVLHVLNPTLKVPSPNCSRRGPGSHLAGSRERKDFAKQNRSSLKAGSLFCSGESTAVPGAKQQQRKENSVRSVTGARRAERLTLQMQSWWSNDCQSSC